MKKKKRFFRRIMIPNFILLGIILFCFPALLTAQTSEKIKVSGNITDKSEEPLIGVSILQKGTTNGTITDFDGNYIIEVPAGSTLEFSYVGYAKQEVLITNQTKVDLVMGEDALALKEVIVVGYAVGSKQTISGAVQKIGKEDMNVGVVNNALDAIQGKVAGVNIQTTSSDPTVKPSVRIRGTTSLSGGNDPLVIVDGVMGDLNLMNSLSPNDIESFTILKDASETAQFGSRGAAGVIVVTTTKGKFGTKTLSYDGNFGVQTVANRLHMLSADEFRQAANERGLSFIDDGHNTDFMDEILRTGLTQNHKISFGNGNEDSNYNVSLGVLDQKGLVKTSNSRRFNLKLDATQLYFDNKLKIEAGMFGSRTSNNRLHDEPGTFYGAAAMNPTYPTGMNDDGTWPRDPGASEITNPFDFLSNTSELHQYNATAHGRLTWTILEGLKFSAFGSYTFMDDETSIYLPTTSREGQKNNGGRGERQDARNENYLGNLSLTYLKTIKKHYINLLGLFEGQEYKRRGFQAASSRYTTDYHGADNLGGGATINYGDVRSYKTNYRLISGLARFNYVYNDRYIATVNLRADGSSKLGKNEKWGFFPSFSLAWNMARESFIKDNLKFVDDFKLRASYGITGNQDAIDPYNSLQLLGVNYDDAQSLIMVNGNPAVAYSYLRNANPDLKWETKKTFDIGFDAAFLEDKFTLTFDYYNSRTDDLLYTYAVPQPPFIFNTLLANIGSMRNYGVEFSLGYAAIRTKDIGLDISGNFSYQKNKITSLTGTYNGQTLTPSAYNRLSWVTGAGQVGNNDVVYMFEGQPLGVFYLPKADGLIENNGRNEYNIQDIDGVEGVNIANGNDRYIAGQAVPKYYVGGNIKFRYKAFDIQTQLNGAFGHKIYNGTALTFNHMGNFPTYNVMEGASEKNIYDNRVSDYWLENGNYLNIAYVTLGYNINTEKLKNWVRSIRITASVNNLHTFTSYSGLTPMINSSTLDADNNTFGVDDKRLYPVARTFSVGLNVNF